VYHADENNVHLAYLSDGFDKKKRAPESFFKTDALSRTLKHSEVQVPDNWGSRTRNYARRRTRARDKRSFASRSAEDTGTAFPALASGLLRIVPRGYD